MSRQVVVLIDVQNDYFPGGRWPLPGIEAARDKIVSLLAFARENAVPIVHVRHEFPADGPFFVEGSHGAQFHDAVAPRDGEVAVVKRQANAFLGTELRQVLERHTPAEIVVAGAMSQMCIDATVRAAADFGYDVTVLHDACAAGNLSFGGQELAAEQVHAAFMAALAGGYARLRTTSEHITS